MRPERLRAQHRSASAPAHGRPLAGLVLLAAVAGLLLAAWDSADAMDEVLQPLSGGATTIAAGTRDAFTRPAANITAEHRRAFMVGQSIFNQNWVAAPSSTRDHQGLGPMFNAQSCSSCHAKGGRGAPPDALHPVQAGLLIRLSVPGRGEHGGPCPEPTYGLQFHPYGIFGIPGDGELVINLRPLDGRFADGLAYSLQSPQYRLEKLAYGPLSRETQLSARVAPVLIGMGLLAAIPEADLRARAAANAGDADGVRGHLASVWDVRAQAMRPGRFGWKAGQPSVEQQIASAFQGDLGITSTLFPHENTMPSHAAALARPSGGEPGGPELSENRLQRITLWASLLGVPVRRQLEDPAVQRGAAVFRSCRCDACHVPTWTTGADTAYPELAHQTIHPFTDLLVHDLGPELADGRADGEAGPQEWRTPPLWGLGLVETVNGHHRLLHDGRARDFAEAVLWHDGEALASRQRYTAAPAADRQALVAFLLSL